MPQPTSAEPTASASTDERAAPLPASTPELTLRAVAFGCFFGGVLAVGNTYLGLKTGWWDPSGITTVLVSFAFFRAVSRAGRGGPFSILENNITQTAATAASSMPATIGFLGAIPALEQLGRRTSPVELLAWGAAVGVFGILLTVPLRRRLIVARGLAFPAGTAVATVTRTLHAEGGDQQRRTRTLVAAGALSAILTWLRDGKPAIVPGTLLAPGPTAAALKLGADVSPMLLAVGMLIGPLLGASLLVGSGVAWIGVAPLIQAMGVVTAADYDQCVAWLLWPGVSLMVASAFTSLFVQRRVLGRGLGDLGGLGTGWRTSLLTLVAAAVAGALAWRFFDLPPLVLLLVLPLTVVLTAVTCHASGETGVAPLAQAGQIAQLAAGLTRAVTAVADIGAGALVGGVPAQTAQNLDSLQAGHLIGNTPRKQLTAMLAGAVVGCLVAVPAYALMTTAWRPGSPELPAPFAATWKAVGLLSQEGTAALPPHAPLAVLIAALAGVLLTVLQENPRTARFAPSPMAMGIGMLVPASLSVAIFGGSMIGLLIGRRKPAWAENHVPTLAAGAITGESLTGVLVAVLRVAGVL